MQLPKERFLTALSRQKPDRVPLVAGWGVVEARLLGLSLEEMVERCGIDAVISWWPDCPDFGEVDRYLERVATDARLGEIQSVGSYARWGYIPPGLSGSSSPELNPLAGAAVRSDIADCIPTVDWQKAGSELSEEVARWQERDVAVAVPLPKLGGLWFEEMQRLRGYEQSVLDLVLNPDLAAFLVERITAVHAEGAAAAARSGADVLWLDDDIGMPGHMIISPETWRRFFKPAIAAVIHAARSVRSDIAVCYHSDGYFEPVVGDLIETGVNALHPVQPDVFDQARLKRRFGSAVAFWGGVGTPTLWAWGSPGDIRAETRRAIADLGPAGFIAAPAYDIEPDVPADNLRAFFQHVADSGPLPTHG